MKLSIIITLFNVEEYIYDLSRSLNANQLTCDFEVIIVNDGSSDESFRLKDLLDNKNVLYFELDNHGVADARNYGLNHASGTWVTFIDGDDYVCDNYFNMINYDTTCDVINNKMDLYVEAMEDVVNHPLEYKFNGNKVVNVNDEYQYFNLSVANLLLRRDIIVANNLLFKSLLISFEDALFYVDYLRCCNGDVLINQDSVYYYRKRIVRNSTIDLAGDNKQKYVEFVRDVYLVLLKNNSTNYIQAMVLYDLWNNMLSYSKFGYDLGVVRDDLVKELIMLIDDDVIYYMQSFIDKYYISYVLSLKTDSDVIYVHNVERGLYYVLSTKLLTSNANFKVVDSVIIYNEFKKFYQYQISTSKLILIIDKKYYFFKSLKNKLLIR